MLLCRQDRRSRRRVRAGELRRHRAPHLLERARSALRTGLRPGGRRYAPRAVREQQPDGAGPVELHAGVAVPVSLPALHQRTVGAAADRRPVRPAGAGRDGLYRSSTTPCTSKAGPTAGSATISCSISASAIHRTCRASTAVRRTGARPCRKPAVRITPRWGCWVSARTRSFPRPARAPTTTVTPATTRPTSSPMAVRTPSTRRHLRARKPAAVRHRSGRRLRSAGCEPPGHAERQRPVRLPSDLFVHARLFQQRRQHEPRAVSGRGRFFGSANGQAGQPLLRSQLEYVPFGKAGLARRPVAQSAPRSPVHDCSRVSTAGDTNYDGFGHSARDNNAVFVYVWTAI